MRVVGIESREDPRIAAYLGVRDACLRRDSGLFGVEGHLGVRRRVTGSRFRTRSLLATRLLLVLDEVANADEAAG